MQELKKPDLERALCGRILNCQDKEGFRVCDKLVSPDDFSDSACSSLWLAFRKADGDGQPFAPGVILNYIKLSGGTVTGADLSRMTYDGEDNVVPYAAEVSTLASKRRLIERMDDLYRRIAIDDESVTGITTELRNIADSESPGGRKVVVWGQVLMDVLHHAEKLMAGHTDETTSSGFEYVDSHGGLRPGDLNVLAGRTSNGKTSLAMCMAMNAAKSGAPVMVYSLEMTIEDLGYRMSALESKLPAARIERDALEQEEFSRLYESLTDRVTSDAPVYFDESRSSDFTRLCESIRGNARDLGVKVVVIDYLQLIQNKNGYRRAESVGDAANRLKALAVETRTCIILLSQLARAPQGGSSQPHMNELKESGDIENAADNVWLVWRAELTGESYPAPFTDVSTGGTALVFNPKSRKGPVGSFVLGFDAGCTKFYDIDRRRYNTADETPF